MPPPPGCEPLSIVWVRVIGYKPSWSPGIVSHVLPSSLGFAKRFFVFFIDNSAFETALLESENVRPLNRILEDGEHEYTHIPAGIQYAWVTEADINSWDSINREKYIKTIAGLDLKKRKLYQNAISYGDRMHADRSSIPDFVVRDSHYRPRPGSPRLEARASKNLPRSKHDRTPLEDNRLRSTVR